MKIIQVQNKPKIFLVFYFVLFALLLNQNSSLGAENELEELSQRRQSIFSQICSINKKNLIREISRVNAYKDELENTMMYKTLIVADYGLSFFLDADDLAYRSIQVLLMGAHAIKSQLPLNVQSPLSAALTCANDLLYCYQLCQFSTKYIVQQTAGYTALLLMNLSMSSDMSGPRHKEVDALIYYLSKRAGWSYDELLTSGWRLFDQNLLMTQGQQVEPVCDPLGEELCFYHPTPGADPDKQSILPIVYNITNGWKQVSLCQQENETENTLCASRFLENLPNFASSGSVIHKELYNNTEFLGSGLENRVYKVGLRHLFYKTSTIALRVWVRSSQGHNKDKIPYYLEMRSRIKRLSTELLNVDDFFPEVFSVYFSSLPGDVEYVKLFKGTEFYNMTANANEISRNDKYFLRGSQTGPLPENVSVEFVSTRKKYPYGMTMLPAFYTEMELIDGGAFDRLSEVPHKSIIEYSLIEYALSTKNLTNLDNRFANIGLKTVPYLRAYHKGNKIYLMEEKSMPQILDWDQMSDKYPLRYFCENAWAPLREDLLSKKTMGFVASIRNNPKVNGWFSSETQKFLEEYLVTDEQIRQIESEGVQVKHYDLGE